MKGITLFDNYEEDGQLSLFNADYDDWDENWIGDEDGIDPGQVDLEQGNGEVSDAENNEVEASEKAPAKTLEKAGGIPVGRAATAKSAESSMGNFGADIAGAGSEIRVKYCASCGKLLFVKEETAGFRSECNNCGIKYFQKL